MHVRMLHTAEELDRYVDFGHEVYRHHSQWVPPDPHQMTALLSGTAPGSSHFQIQPFWVEADDQIQATLTAVIDESYNRHWNEQLGHLLFFEALPDQDVAVLQLFQAACAWLRERGCQAARLSFLYGWQNPLTIDAYDTIPTVSHTYNPVYYHSYIKQGGFATERGLLEYQIRFTPELAEWYRQIVAHATDTGVTLRSWDFAHLEAETAAFTDLYNASFATHWGAPPITLDQLTGLTIGLRDLLVADFMAFAEVEGHLAGGILALPDLNQAFHRVKGRADEDYLPALGQALQAIDHGVALIVGVVPQFRGRGLSLALAARSYLAMIARGYKTGSYTIVLDDNWPSRRTAEKLGAHVARNFVVYRKTLI